MTETRRKFALAALSTDGLADKRQVLVNCSSESIDRQGDIVVQSGIQTASFLKTGGTVLWNHDPALPIAKAVTIGVENNQLRALAQFPEAGISAKADEIYGLVKAGVVNSVSIGFKPLKWTPLDEKHPWDGQRFEESELMEFSFVSVPAQADATVIARSNKQTGTWKVGASLTLPTAASDAFDADVAADRIFEHAGFDEARPDLNFARKGFLVYNGADPRDPCAYKAPFAELSQSGRLTVTPASLLSARADLAETDIPEDARAKALAVLDHYEAKMSDTSASWLKIKAALDPKADPETVALIKSWHVAAKAGRVLSEENMAHVRGLEKCLGDMAMGHAKCMSGADDVATQVAKVTAATAGYHADLQGLAAHINQAAEHAKALHHSGRGKPASGDGDGGDDDYADPDDAGADVELAGTFAVAGLDLAARQRLVEIAAARAL